nr:isoleucine--tRNA ligase [candidate division Zixibacteria bacterium]
MKFDQLKDFSIPAMEAEVLNYWEDNRIFEKSMEAVMDRPHFVFYEGPPTANGRPGIHHIIARTIKDLVCRYKTMKGYRVDRKAGWDTHGLPVEIEVEKALNLDTKAKVVEYGVERFNQKCRESVFKYINDWNEITRKIGYWLDLSDAYITLTDDYVETVWWILKNLFDRDLIYKGFKTVPFCPRCETGLSSHEVAQGYMEVSDPSVFIKVKAADSGDDFAYVVWTTTPWTLPSNAALCMHPDADYALVEFGGEKLVLAAALLDRVLGEGYREISRKKGSEYINKKYKPIFDTFKDQADKAFYIINANFVTLEDGSGIVHIAPGYGADDYEVGQKHGLPVLQAVAADGHFKEDSGKYAGKWIKDTDPEIIRDLKEAGKLFKKETYIHNYPFCWRCDSPLVYITRHSWYIKTTQFKEQLIRNNNITNWYPDEIRVGRMLDWLENNVDWALSRERFWGTPLPIWICDSCGHKTAVGSIEQLRREGINVPDKIDVHKPGIDLIKLKCDKCGGVMTRVPEVIDTWFDSGAMPYAQWHHPFENQEMFEIKYPADFISEAVDQTRGWFYTLLSISTMLFDKPAFKNVIVIEMILDKLGKKMSKHKGNVVDPFEIIEKHGADPLRWYMLFNSNPWVPTKFDEDGLVEVIRKLFDTLKNSYTFFALYANVDEIAGRANKAGGSVEEFLENLAGEPERIDRWIVSRFNTVVKKVGERLDNYDLTPPTRIITDFVIDDLSNWYIRLNRRRFWAGGDDPSKMRAYLTLYRVLLGTVRLMAPFTPFIAEFLHRQLTMPNNGTSLPSIHMEEYPVPDELLIEPELEESMSLVQQVVSLGRAARNRKNLKVRQPLSGIRIHLQGQDQFEKIESQIDTICEELNIRAVEELKDVSEVVSYQAKLNFAKAGPRFGGAVKEAAGKIQALDSTAIAKFIRKGNIEIVVGSEVCELTAEEIEVIKLEKEGYAVESGNTITVALRTEIDDILRDEGFAREMINKIQNMRKSSGFEVTDRISVMATAAEPLFSAVKKHRDFICGETLADTIDLVDSIPKSNGGKKWNINGVEAEIAVIKK